MLSSNSPSVLGKRQRDITPSHASKITGLLTPPETQKKQCVNEIIGEKGRRKICAAQRPCEKIEENPTPTALLHPEDEDKDPIVLEDPPFRSQAAQDFFRLAPLAHTFEEYRFPISICGRSNPTIHEISDLDEEEADAFLFDIASFFPKDHLPHDYPGLLETLTTWSSNYIVDTAHGTYGGQTLTNVPISFLEKLLGDESKEEDLKAWAAVTFHLWEREPEIPGSKYRLWFGRNKGKTIQDIVDDEGEEFINWMKRERIPLRRGHEELAEAIEFFHAQQFEEFDREFPNAAKTRLPPLRNYMEYEDERLVDLDENVLARLLKQARWLELNEGLERACVDDAIRWKELERMRNRWNWNGIEENGTPKSLGHLARPWVGRVKVPWERRNRDETQNKTDLFYDRWENKD